MARKFKVFSELDKHFRDSRNKEIKQETKQVTPEEIKSIVSREVNAASTKNQMMNYFDSIAASSERTETMLVELRDVLDAGLARIDAAAGRNDNDEKLEQIDASVKRVLELSESLENIDTSVQKVASVTDCLDGIDASVRKVADVSENLEATIHKDNLISYKNLKDAIDAVEAGAKKRENKLKGGIIASVIFNILTFIMVVVLILMNLGII